MLIGNSQWDPAFEDEAVEAFLELRVDGLVLLGIAPTSETLIEATAYTPTVVVGERDIDLDGVDIVVDDDQLGARLAIDHLVRTRPPAHRAHRGRAVSRPAARATWWPCAGTRWRRTSWSRRDFTEEGGTDAALALLTRDPRPTAIFAANDMVALGVLSPPTELGLRVPEDLSVVGYDNTHLSASGRISLTASTSRAAPWAGRPPRC